MNLRKLNLGLVALVLGLGLVITQSAFKSSSNLATKTYYHDGANNKYVLSPPLGTSCTEDDYYCTIVFEGDVLPTESEFDETAIPIGEWETEMGDLGSYQ